LPGTLIPPNPYTGKAYIFKRDGTSWTQQAVLTAADATPGDEFGSSVSLSGNYALIGSPKKDVGANADQGKIYIFSRVGNNWIQQASLIDSTGKANAAFGYSVHINGDYVIAGNYSNMRATIFNRAGGNWNRQVTLLPPDNAIPFNRFGCSVTISNDYAVVGANQAKIGANTNQGKAYIFRRTGISWLQQAVITGSDGVTDDKFGTAVNINGPHIIVGVPNKNYPGGQTNAGKIYFFSRQ